MQVEAIYDHGKLEFVTALQLRHDRVRLLVTVPDEEIMTEGDPYGLPPEVINLARTMREQLEAIRNAPLPADDELPALSDKYVERAAAFELREDR